MIKFTNCECQVEKGSFNINEIPLECPAVWNLISNGYTVGVFQLEKKLGQDWARKVKPQNIEELAALTALLRPGPLEAKMAQDYVDIKFGRKKPTYLHPMLKPILESTYGCLVYQEQAIRIAIDLAGFNPIDGDNLRKSIGKKKPELMAELKSKFVIGCQNNKIDKSIAEEIFSWIEKCQRYSFNLSHAISYAMIAYQTSWLKCHFPQEFFTSYLTYSVYKSDSKEEVYGLVQDARLFGINIVPPDIRRRNIHFQMIKNPQNSIAFGLAHIRGVGQTAIQTITEINPISLEEWGGFLASVPNLHRDVGIALIKSGACDCYNMERVEMIRELEVILGTTTRNSEGKKIEVKGLTNKERKFFFDKLKEGKTTKMVLEEMVKQVSKSPTLSQMKKCQIIALAIDRFGCTEESLKGQTKKAIMDKLLEDGYDNSSSRPACSSDARRQAIAEKITMLKDPIHDTNIGNATAEKYFLGISLSCSPADDADNSLANHSCLEVAQSRNSKSMIVCAVIDGVKHTKTKRGRNPGSSMCFLTISDSSYSIDHAVVFPDIYDKLKHFCKENLVCLIFGEKKNGSFIVTDIQKLL